MPKHPKRRTRRNLAVLALSALCLTGFLYWDNTALQVARFDPVFSDLPAGFDGCRIVILSDLHGASFGAHNADLLAAVAACVLHARARQPDEEKGNRLRNRNGREKDL